MGLEEPDWPRTGIEDTAEEWWPNTGIVDIVVREEDCCPNTGIVEKEVNWLCTCE